MNSSSANLSLRDVYREVTSFKRVNGQVYVPRLIGSIDDSTKTVLVSFLNSDDVLPVYHGEKVPMFGLLYFNGKNLMLNIYRGKSGDYSNKLSTTLVPEDEFSMLSSHVYYAMLAAQQRTIHAEIASRVDGLFISYSGGMCPFQSEGYIGEHSFYFRYRHGCATLNIDSVPITQSIYHAGVVRTTEDDGYLDFDEFEETLIQLFKELRVKPYSYKFVGTGSECAFSYGWSPEDAWEKLHEVPVWVTNGSVNMTAEDYKEFLDKKHLNPIPVTVDDRIFPENFVVRVDGKEYPVLSETN